MEVTCEPFDPLPDDFTGIIIRNKGKVCCSDLSTSQGGGQTCFPLLTASKLPACSNVTLIYPLIKWKTIEMSAGEV